MKNIQFLSQIVRVVFVLTLLVGFSANVIAAQSRIVAAFGSAKVNGKPALVEVIVQVNPGKSVKDVVRSALADQGARPIDHADLGSLPGFEVTGLIWGSSTVTQYYNDLGEPVDGVESILMDTHTKWNAVAGSGFEFIYGGSTTRCPSLVRECPGSQVTDNNNDVGWVNLKGCCTLGVTWFVDGEADMALDSISKFVNWSTSGLDNTDVETVLLHENGHVAGLGHSDYQGAVMEAIYDGPRATLAPDDKYGITYLYPRYENGSVSGTVTDSTHPIEGATVELEGTNPSLSATTDSSGDYSISGIPQPVWYTVKASADGCASVAEGGVTVDISAVQNFELDCGTSTGGSCDLLPVGAECTSDGDCCSNKCKGGGPAGPSCK